MSTQSLLPWHLLQQAPLCTPLFPQDGPHHPYHRKLRSSVYCASHLAVDLRVGYLSRKALPIKRNDAEPLTREDVQYDLLHHIFSDARTVFTNSIKNIPGETPAKLHFCDLYVNALYKSSKCSKVLKDKMVETPMFAVELAKISLLTNVGRINTTMACTYSGILPNSIANKIMQSFPR